SDLLGLYRNSQVAAKVIHSEDLIGEPALDQCSDWILRSNWFTSDLNKLEGLSSLLLSDQHGFWRGFGDLFFHSLAQLAPRVCIDKVLFFNQLTNHQNGLQNRFRRRRATWNIDVHRYDFVNSLHYVISSMKPSGGRASSHAQNPFRIRHLFVYPFEHRAHLVGDGSHDHQQIRLSRGETNHLSTESRDIIVRRDNGHVLNSAAGCSEGQRPQRVFARPVCYFANLGGEEAVSNR